MGIEFLLHGQILANLENAPFMSVSCYCSSSVKASLSRSNADASVSIELGGHRQISRFDCVSCIILSRSVYVEDWFSDVEESALVDHKLTKYNHCQAFNIFNFSRMELVSIVCVLRCLASVVSFRKQYINEILS